MFREDIEDTVFTDEEFQRIQEQHLEGKVGLCAGSDSGMYWAEWGKLMTVEECGLLKGQEQNRRCEVSTPRGPKGLNTYLSGKISQEPYLSVLSVLNCGGFQVRVGVKQTSGA